MMRIALALIAMGALGGGQVTNPPAATAPVDVDVAPLRPPDLASPYASPRDAARHRLQFTLADLQSKRDVRAAVRGFASAAILDPNYPAAIFNFAIVAALAERWEDAAVAFEDVMRLDAAGLGAQAKTQLERLRLIAEFEKTAEGKQRRRYDEALFPLLARLPQMPEAEAMAALAEVGRIDPKRWESPSLLAARNGNGRGYDVAAKFLAIAVANAPSSKLKAALQRALDAAERELRYASARAAAEVAADGGDHAKAAELFEAAWTTIPARAANGIDAASELLLGDDTARAAALLSRLRGSGEPNLAASATAMLKHLEPIEPAAKAADSGDASFFRDAGSLEPVRISTLVPPVDTAEMEVLARPLPRLAPDPDAVVLLASLSTDAAEAAQAALPAMAEPSVTLENAWKAIQAARRMESADAANAVRDLQTVDLAKDATATMLLKVATKPAGSQVLLDDRADTLCQTPCDLRVEAGIHTVRLALPGFKDEKWTISTGGKVEEILVPLTPVRGNVLVQTLTPAALKVNGTAIAVPSPAELALLPGLHVITADFGTVTRERMLMVNPGVRLRIELKP